MKAMLSAMKNRLSNKGKISPVAASAKAHKTSWAKKGASFSGKK